MLTRSFYILVAFCLSGEYNEQCCYLLKRFFKNAWEIITFRFHKERSVRQISERQDFSLKEHIQRFQCNLTQEHGAARSLEQEIFQHFLMEKSAV